MHPLTRHHLLDTLREEAVSAAQLLAYAGRAEADGHTDAARTLRQLARVDADHARRVLEELGWVGSLRDNVLSQLVGDTTAHGLPYARYAIAARRTGDHAAGALFGRLAEDETEAALVLITLLGGHTEAREEVPSHDAPQAPTPPAPRAPAPHAQAALAAPVVRPHAAGGAQGRGARAVRAPVAPRTARAAAGVAAPGRS